DSADRARVHEAVMAEAAVTMLGLGAVSKFGALKTFGIFLVAASLGSVVVAITGSALKPSPPPIRVVEAPPAIAEIELQPVAPEAEPEPVVVKRAAEKKPAAAIPPLPAVVPEPPPAAPPRKPAVSRC